MSVIRPPDFDNISRSKSFPPTGFRMVPGVQKLYFCMNARQKTFRFTHVQRCKNTIFALLRKVFDLLNILLLRRCNITVNAVSLRKLRSAKLKDFGRLSRVVRQYFSESFQCPKLSGFDVRLRRELSRTLSRTFGTPSPLRKRH